MSIFKRQFRVKHTEVWICPYCKAKLRVIKGKKQVECPRCGNVMS